MVGTLREYKINKENVFKTNTDEKQEKEQIRNKKPSKPAGRPKKSEVEVCNKKVIIYFTENELNDILQKTGSIATSPFLKKIILDNLKYINNLLFILVNV